MILHGNQRAGGRQLAQHLLNSQDNDHVTIHEIRGFVSENLPDEALSLWKKDRLLLQMGLKIRHQIRLKLTQNITAN